MADIPFHFRYYWTPAFHTWRGQRRSYSCARFGSSGVPLSALMVLAHGSLSHVLFGLCKAMPALRALSYWRGQGILGAWLIAVGQGSAPPATCKRDERGRRIIPVGGRHGSNSERAHGLGPSNGRCPAAVCWRSVGYPRPLSRTQFCSCHPLTASTGRIRPQGFYCLVLDTLAVLTFGILFRAVCWRC